MGECLCEVCGALDAKDCNCRVCRSRKGCPSSGCDVEGGWDSRNDEGKLDVDSSDIV